jgi:hypothetical protein
MAGTTVYNINKPTVAGDSGVWGGFLNTGMDTIDNEIARSRIPFVSPTYNVAGTTTLDLNQTTGGRVFVFTVSGASTLAFSNVPSSSFDCKVSLVISNGSAFALTFPASVSWLAGVAPTFKASGVDIVDLETKDAGTTWYASLRGRPSLLYQNQGLSTVSAVDASVASYTLPANMLSVNGQALRILATGTSSGSTGGNVTVKFGATTLGTFAFTNGQVWRLDSLVTRNTNTVQFNNTLVVVGVTLQHGNTGAAETLSGTVVIDFRGNVSGGGTLSMNAVSVEYRSV